MHSILTHLGFFILFLIAMGAFLSVVDKIETWLKNKKDRARHE